MILGIDPGLSGGVALVSADTAMAWKMPTTLHDTWDLFRGLAAGRQTISKAYIENVHAMPKQGVSSTFKFGRNVGQLEMALAAAGIPFEYVTPTVWQRALGCLSKGDKLVTKAMAQRLFPALRITHALADALLIAEFGRRREAGMERKEAS